MTEQNAAAGGRIGYYDRDGQPIDFERYMALLTEHGDGYKRVGLSTSDDGQIRVSTVWLGLDHNWGGGSPLIFETMVFGGEHDEEQWRWSTEAEASAGHAEIASAVLREGAPTKGRHV